MDNYRSIIVICFVAATFLNCISSSTCYTCIQVQLSRLFHKYDRYLFDNWSSPSFAHLSLSLSDETNGEGNDISDLNFMKDLNARNDEIKVELMRGRLEQANVVDFLKRKPRKLPYNDARRWIQANLGADTKEEFYDLVENGNLRTPYIPKCPEKYYTQTREWISWEHFLTGIFDKEQPSAVRPSTGVFD